MHTKLRPTRGAWTRRKIAARLWALRAGALIVLALPAGAAPPEAASKSRPGADEAIAIYQSTPAHGAVAELGQRLERGETRLEFSEKHGYLPALLRELKISTSSQLLVASKTSPNKAHISPKNPRALYFNEAAALAYVPGAEVIEVAAVDPNLGTVFYSLEQKAVPQPRLTRDNRCLECHASAKTLEVPGWLVRSFLTHTDGEVDVLSGLMVTHRTPLAERWGGYYVTGDTGGQPHRGNLFGPDALARPEKAPAPPARVTDLSALLEINKFPAPSSDVVALMVLEHQVHALNLLARLRQEASELKESDPFDRAQPTSEALLKYLLFRDEAPLAASVRGAAEFARQFEALGPADAQGRSLRQFDLQTRLFRYPCSFMIYSPSFDALPVRARRHLYRRLWEVLSGEDASADYRTLAPDMRAALREILVQTKKDLPAYWRL